MLNPQFTQTGYCHIDPDFYFENNPHSSIHDLKKLFDDELKEDGNAFRKRAYLKLSWQLKTNEITLHPNQYYFQTADFNPVDGDKIRQFKVLNQKTLEIPVLKNIIEKNTYMIRQLPEFKNRSELTLGLHFIRYQASKEIASYSSPAWLHKDNEPLVFIHLVNLSQTALGGDNLIADDKTKNVTQVIRLEETLETLVLNQKVYHAVTPLGSKKGIATRDIILFTIEPNYHLEKIA